MTPNFALSLSFEGIGLLCRVDGGWHLLDETPVDAEDLPATLAGFRARLEELEADFTTLLILPDDQVKYLDLRATFGDPRVIAAQALEESTPYKAQDLVFDIDESNGGLKVAAVARETLQEAESFAVEHHFNPAGFSAMPEPALFATAPDFGPAASFSAPYHPETARIDIISAGDLPRPVEPQFARAQDGDGQDGGGQDGGGQDDDRQDVGGPGVGGPGVGGPGVGGPGVGGPGVGGDGDPLPTFGSLRSGTVDQEPPAPQRPEPKPELQPEAQEISAPPAQDQAPATFSSIRAHRNDDAAKAGPLGGATRGKTNAPSIPIAGYDARARGFDPARVAASLRADPESKRKRGSILRRTKPSPPPAGSVPVTETPAPKRNAPPRSAKSDERKSMTVFGARDKDAVGGKPRYLGLALTLMLLVFLAGIAAWASLTLDGGIGGLLRRDAPVQVADPVTAAPQGPVAATVASPLPETLPETLPDTLSDAPSDSVSASASLPLPLASPSSAPITPMPDATAMLPEPTMGDEFDTTLTAPDFGIQENLTQDQPIDTAEIEAMDPDTSVRMSLPSPRDAEARYAITGVWERAPSQPDTPPIGSINDLYLTSIDHDIADRLAYGLPTPDSLLTDRPIVALISPQPWGTEFDLDEDGFVRATPDGAISPEGIFVFLGKPDTLPPAWPKRIIVGQSQNEDAALTSQLAKLRPQFRPDDLLEKSERSNFGGLTLSELAGFRPKYRPPLAKAEEEADMTPTALAVTNSARPRLRPANFAQLVARIEPIESPLPVAASATVTPDIPTTASVARQATVKNALNLSKVNLIGVFGTSQSRRALVRLATGRYKKVQVGDRIDGGEVAAISETELHYVKGGRSLVLTLPNS